MKFYNPYTFSNSESTIFLVVSCIFTGFAVACALLAIIIYLISLLGPWTWAVIGATLIGRTLYAVFTGR